ncbi:MAG: 30S ribosomal protein S8 [Candidatus Yanofskybacteria bacterium]|nr:30S ribosomal protein S8 [Candidatus Yanofskybacteria bacterium]
MMVTDPISDMLIQIKNAQAVGHEQVALPFSKVKFRIAEILKAAGYLADVERKNKKSEKTEHEFLYLTLKYQDNEGALSGLKLISRPSRRMYIKAKEIKPVRSGHGLAVISTPKGIMDSKEARKNNLGGEILFEVW